MARIHLVRHGATEWNQEARYQGQCDIHLSAVGKAEAGQLGKCFVGEPLDMVYSSDLCRAVETAQAVAEPHGLTPKLSSDLREIDFGCWEGLTYQEILTQYPEQWRTWTASDGAVADHGGETIPEFQKRVCQAVQEIADAHPEGTVAIVMHGGPVKALLCGLLETSTRQMEHFRVDNASITTIDFFGKYSIIQRVNDCHHLIQL